jgi:hypothetical protein
MGVMSTICEHSEAAKQCTRLDEMFAAGSSEGLIANLKTDLFALDAGRSVIPATLNDRRDAPTCYLCCASAAYVDYAREEMRNFQGRPAVKAALYGLLSLAAPLVRTTGFDHQVQPNNWLFSTNIWCGLSAREIEEVTGRLLKSRPDRAIVWRSLNDVTDTDAIGWFRAAGYDIYPARQVYLFDCRTASPAIHRDERRDMALLGEVDYQLTPPEGILAGDFERIEALYAKLYLDKYTRLNPQYTALLLKQLHDARILRFFGLRNRDGQLDGVVGFFEQGDVMTAPVVGYDTSIDQDVGLYRRLMAIGLKRARERRILFNMSAGAAAFKRNRGAVSAIEYAAVYSRHLSRKSRAAAYLVRTILQRVGVPIMRKYEL